jgi:hypothetical protein
MFTASSWVLAAAFLAHKRGLGGQTPKTAEDACTFCTRTQAQLVLSPTLRGGHGALLPQCTVPALKPWKHSVRRPPVHLLSPQRGLLYLSATVSRGALRRNGGRCLQVSYRRHSEEGRPLQYCRASTDAATDPPTREELTRPNRALSANRRGDAIRPPVRPIVSKSDRRNRLASLSNGTVHLLAHAPLQSRDARCSPPLVLRITSGDCIHISAVLFLSLFLSLIGPHLLDSHPA